MGGEQNDPLSARPLIEITRRDKGERAGRDKRRRTIRDFNVDRHLMTSQVKPMAENDHRYSVRQ